MSSRCSQCGYPDTDKYPLHDSGMCIFCYSSLDDYTREPVYESLPLFSEASED